MKYALNLAEDGRILSVTFEKFAPANAVLVEKLPENNVTDYRIVEGSYLYDPISESRMEEKPDRLDAVEAQLIYTAMMTDTLLEV